MELLHNISALMDFPWVTVYLHNLTIFRQKFIYASLGVQI